jgi:N-acetylglucosamine-6-phosphate deacetylase
MLYIHNATILTPDQCLENGALLTDRSRIVQVGGVEQVTPPATVHKIDATGLLLVPGFIDLQINGAFGHDFTADPASIWAVAARLPRYGVTAFMPTIVTSPPETSFTAQQVLAQGVPAGQDGALPLGLHLEGPFLNPEKKGAHNPAYLRLPAPEIVADWSPEQGVRLVTLAPELPGALEVVAALVARGVVVSAGHSLASYAQARAAFEAGVTYGTHLFNTMPPLRHREPGLIGALLEESGVRVGLIPDGIHVHPAIVSLVWKATGPERLTLVSDAIAAMGMPPGRYQIGDLQVVVDETISRLADGTLAGSILTLDAALRNLIAYTGCTLGAALATITTTPAALLGLSHRRGRLAPGLAADMALLTPNLRVSKTIVGGRVIYNGAGATNDVI